MQRLLALVTASNFALAACQTSSAPGAQETPSGLAEHPCIQAQQTETPLGELELVAGCDSPFEVNSASKDITHFETKVRGARGGALISSKTSYGGGTSAASIFVEATEAGIILDAGLDGKVEVRPAPLDNSSEAALEVSLNSIIVDVTNPGAARTSSTILCPNLADFATAIQEQGVPTPPDNGDQPKCTSPDPTTGCFPCPNLAAVVSEAPLFKNSDLRTRVGATLALAQHVNAKNGPDARDPITAIIVGIIAAIGATALAGGVCWPWIKPGEDTIYGVKCKGEF